MLIAALLATFAMNAQHVTEEQALQKAHEFLNKKVKAGSRHNAPVKVRQLAKAAQNDAYYIFNAEQDGGFVIVSSDERTDEILGYSTEGNIDPDNMPENMKAWLKGYEEEIKALPANAQNAPSNVPLHPAVEPLITTKWNQPAPYNLQCPVHDGKYCITGCVATAMAQVMNYHKWPQDITTAIPAYDYGESEWDEETQTNIYKYHEDELPPTTFEWDLMKDNYDKNETGPEAQAVAKLMRYCGQAVKMEYSPYESIAYQESALLMIDYFGYDKGAKHVSRIIYNNREWDELIYREIAANRPVLYSGYPAPGPIGHAFVCDGYDGNGLYHFNWGWGGSQDGFFRLSLLNPSIYDFSAGQDVVLGIQPPTPQIKNINEKVAAYIHFLEDESLKIYANFINYSDSYLMIDGAVGQINADGSVTVLSTLMEKGFLENMDSYIETDCRSFDLPDGTYKLIALWKEISETQWHYWGETTGNYNYWALTVNGNQRTFEEKYHRYEDDYRYTVTIEPMGNLITNEQQQLAIHFVNEGVHLQRTLQLYVSQTEEKGNRVDRTTIYVDKGTDETAYMSFTPKKEGTYHVWVIEGLYGEVEAQADVQIVKPLSLSMNNGEYNWNNNTMKVCVSNNNDMAYDGDVAMHIWQREQDESEAQEYMQHVYVGQRESKEVIFQCGELDRDKFYYCGLLYCKNPNNNVMSSGYNTSLKPMIHGSFWVGDICYSIVDENNLVVMASLVQSWIDSRMLKVPATIVNPGNGVTYTVHGIDENFCKGVCNLEEVIICEGITTIERNAFYDCPQLCKLTLPTTLCTIASPMISGCPMTAICSKAEEAPLVVGGKLLGVSWSSTTQTSYDNIKLYIPEGSSDSYRREWPHFNHIYVKDYSEIRGDVNGDGLVNSGDVMTVYSIMAGKQ